MEFYPNVCSAEESDRIVDSTEKHFEKNGFGLFATELKETRELIGFVGLQFVTFESHFTPAVEIGWRISFNQWGLGLAPEAAQEVLRFGFETLKLPEIIAMTVPNNKRSLRVMKKLGMIHDTTGNFENPKIAVGHHLRPHVLYRIKAQ